MFLQLTKGYLLSLPARRLAVQPKIRTVLTHCSLSDADRRKKKHPDVPGMYGTSAITSCVQVRRRCKPAYVQCAHTACAGGYLHGWCKYAAEWLINWSDSY